MTEKLASDITRQLRQSPETLVGSVPLWGLLVEKLASSITHQLCLTPVPLWGFCTPGVVWGFPWRRFTGGEGGLPLIKFYLAT